MLGEGPFHKRDRGSRKGGREGERHICIYIYAVGGESWPPQGGDLVPSTLPAAEPSILARVKIGNFELRKPRGFTLPDPPGPGTKFPPQLFLPKNALRNSNRNFTETTNFIVFSCFFGPSFGDAPKTRKNHHAESAYYPRSFLRGFFLYKFLFFCLILTWLVWPTPT